MMTNATITKIIDPPVADSTGKRSYGAGTAVNIRALLDAPTRAQTIALAQRIAEATAVIYTPKPIPGSATIDRGSRIIAAVDGSAAETYEVQYVIDRQLAGGLSHFECFVKSI